MIDNLNNVIKRLQTIQQGGKALANRKPEFVKEFEQMYNEALSKHQERVENQETSAKPPVVNTIDTIDMVNRTAHDIKVFGDYPVDVDVILKKSDGMMTGAYKNDREQIDDAIRRASDKHKVAEDVIRAVIKAESNYDTAAVSHAGAMGLMQLMPDTARELGVDDPFDIYQNIDGGTSYIKQMLNRFDGNLEKALAAYNAGPSRVERANGIPDITETKNYVAYIKNLLVK